MKISRGEAATIWSWQKWKTDVWLCYAPMFSASFNFPYSSSSEDLVRYPLRFYILWSTQPYPPSCLFFFGHCPSNVSFQVPLNLPKNGHSSNLIFPHSTLQPVRFSCLQNVTVFLVIQHVWLVLAISWNSGFNAVAQGQLRRVSSSSVCLNMELHALITSEEWVGGLIF